MVNLGSLTNFDLNKTKVGFAPLLSTRDKLRHQPLVHHHEGRKSRLMCGMITSCGIVVAPAPRAPSRDVASSGAPATCRQGDGTTSRRETGDLTPARKHHSSAQASKRHLEKLHQCLIVSRSWSAPVARSWILLTFEGKSGKLQ